MNSVYLQRCLALLSIFTFIFIMPLFSQVQAASITWVSNGKTINWSDKTNWSSGNIPTKDDDIIFDGKSSNSNSNIDLGVDNITIKSLTITSTYKGKIVNNTKNLNISNATGTAFLQKGGTFVASKKSNLEDTALNDNTTNNINITGNFQFKNGKFLSYSTYNLYLNGNVNLSSFSEGFDSSNSTFIFGRGSIDCFGNYINNIVVRDNIILKDTCKVYNLTLEKGSINGSDFNSYIPQKTFFVKKSFKQLFGTRIGDINSNLKIEFIGKDKSTVYKENSTDVFKAKLEINKDNSNIETILLSDFNSLLNEGSAIQIRQGTLYLNSHNVYSEYPLYMGSKHTGISTPSYLYLTGNEIYPLVDGTYNSFVVIGGVIGKPQNYILRQNNYPNLIVNFINPTDSLIANAYSEYQVNYDLAINNGKFISPSILDIAGNFSVALSATFVNSSGTVNMKGINQTITGNIVFNNLYKYSLGLSKLTISANSLITVTSDLYLTDCILRSSIDGTQWKIDSKGTKYFNNIDVKDSLNVNALPIDTTSFNGIKDSGNNKGWIFKK